MEIKKNQAHNLETRYSLRLFTGLAVAVSITLVAFEWRTLSTTKAEPPGEEIEKWTVEVLPPTVREEKKQEDKPKELEKRVIKTDEINVTDKKETEEKKEEETKTEEKKELVFEVKKIEELPEEKEVEEIFTIVEEMPEYPGGDKALFKFLGNNTKYPEIPKQNGVSGVVYVSFVVDKTGQVTDVKVVRGVDPYLDKEAVRVVSSLKNYKPGKQRGKPVAVAYTLPIRFELH